jgi:hypothetical protein
MTGSVTNSAGGSLFRTPMGSDKYIVIEDSTGGMKQTLAKLRRLMQVKQESSWGLDIRKKEEG